ncbi:plasmid mobilization protein [Taibaiella koreensis]|uniref:plasmid mobilization protein n=1 Tax=Taibaiella koreensis TaxID=1268548 RepID=UPI000E59E282|nr:plasmid mobilization relaxosome protein MobC [Taibaiella koreensis]
MNDKKIIKDKWLHLRLSNEELLQLQKAFSKTTEKKISKYARNILLGKPMIATYRNLSMDSLLTAFVQLNKTLNGIANNYNQSVHRLHTFDHDPQVRAWLLSQSETGQMLLENIAEIRLLIRKITEDDSRY